MKIVVIGATGHIGKAATQALEHNHEVIRASRTSLPGVDITNRASIEDFFASVGVFDALICAVGAVPFKPVSELTPDDYVSAFEGKVLSQVNVVHEGLRYLSDRGSITLTTGILAREPIRTGSAASLANGAVESFVRAAAPELPRGIRLNAVSPTVLEEATEYHGAFAGFVPVSSREVGSAFVRSVEGLENGHIFELD